MVQGRDKWSVRDQFFPIRFCPAIPGKAIPNWRTVSFLSIPLPSNFLLPAFSGHLHASFKDHGVSGENGISRKTAFFAHKVRDFHRNNSPGTRSSHAILIATEEKSFREEGGIEAGSRIGDETHFRQLKTVGGQEAFTTCKYGRTRDVRVPLAGSEEFRKRKVVIWFPKTDLRKFESLRASSRKRIRPLAFLRMFEWAICWSGERAEFSGFNASLLKDCAAAIAIQQRGKSLFTFDC